MARWSEVEAAEPDFARRVHARFTSGKHCTMATLRKDGSPRISGTEVQFQDGDLWIGSMAMAMKAFDLRRDPRLALHSPTQDPPEGEESTWPGEAKIAGTAHEVTDPASEDGSHRFRIEIHEMVLTRVGDPADHLVIEAWHPGRGLEQRRRS